MKSDKKKKIAIFVSQRIDLNCETIDNPLYINMRCGAIYDKENKLKLKGDNTKNNISKLRDSFCELTVQYWAWKNYTADYYGLCHYRRFISFSNIKYPVIRMAVVEKGSILKNSHKYLIDNEMAMQKYIEKYDAIIPEYVDISTAPIKSPGEKPYYATTVYDWWCKKITQIDKKCLDFTIQLVKELKPEYYDYLMEYLNGRNFLGSCCYVLNKELFNKLCEYQFDVLFELIKRFDCSKYTGQHARQPGFMGEIMYASFMIYIQKNKYKSSINQLVFFENPELNSEKAQEFDKAKAGNKDTTALVAPQVNGADTYLPKKGFRNFLKIIANATLPTYRTNLRIEEKLNYIIQNNIIESNLETSLTIKDKEQKINLEEITPKPEKPKILTIPKWSRYTLTSDPSLYTSCFALEVHEAHKEAFHEFKNCNSNTSVAVIATGPSMKHYNQIPNVPHIGMNAAFKNPDISLSYYFTTDYESRNPWFDDLKNYDFIKFFGQYSSGTYRDRFQVSEKLMQENHAKRFFQGAPCEDIPYNIEFYPLMGFYSVAFQALTFAIYTNPKKIYLVGCDCSNSGYYDGTTQLFANVEMWLKGYRKLKKFVDNFYPDTEMISINPIGLKGLFHDVYTESFLADNPKIDRNKVEIIDKKLFN